MLETMTSDSGIRLAISFVLSALLGKRGYQKQSLDAYGAIAAFSVGFLTLACGYRFGILLLGFYFSGSKLTKVRARVKQKLDENYKIGGQRSAKQVLACSILATVIAMYHFVLFGDEDRAIDFESSSISSILLASYIGHYACCAADTWASEVGVLSTSDPILITTLKRVPPGTNGGISFIGTLASIAGGAFVGLLFYFVSLFSSTAQIQVIVFGAIMGLIGSLLDSLLGATLQATWYNPQTKTICREGSSGNQHDKASVHICGIHLLSNEQVNAVSVVLTTLVSGVIAQMLF